MWFHLRHRLYLPFPFGLDYLFAFILIRKHGLLHFLLHIHSFSHNWIRFKTGEFDWSRLTLIRVQLIGYFLI